MQYEFEGRSEKEAIERAIDELGLERNHFDVELLNTSNEGIFNLQKKVRIRIHVADGNDYNDFSDRGSYKATHNAYTSNSAPENESEELLHRFLSELIQAMGYRADVDIVFREPGKLVFRIDSDYNALLIGKRGKNLDAIQLLLGVFATKNGLADLKVIVDIENYRGRREDSLYRLAHRVGDQVMRSKRSKLLEPMNAYERRLIHSALSDIENLETLSEGEGLIKQIRVSYTGF